MTRETTTLTVTYTETDDELYNRYQTQTQRQRVDLTLDLREGRLYAAPWGNIGGGQSMTSFHGLDVEWRIPPLRVHAFRWLVDAISDDCQTILDHTEICHDGSNLVGRPDEEAQLAYDAVQSVIDSTWDPSDVWEPWDPCDWYQTTDLDTLGITVDMTDEQIAEHAQSEVDDADAVLDVDDVERYLLRCRDDAREELAESVDDDDLEQLRAEAGRAGDLEQVAICDRALAGDEMARIACARVIDDAQAAGE